MNNKFLVGALVVIALLVSGLYFKGGSELLGGGTRMQNGISADNTSPVAGEVRGTTLTVTSTITAAIANLSGLLTLNAGALHSSVLATSTGSNTIGVLDLNGYETVIVTPTGANGTKTLTFAASTTMSAWLPTAGDWQDTCFINASTTAATTFTWAAGTGIDLEIASSTTGGSATTLVTPADSATCFRFIRKAATTAAFDIFALITRTADAD